MNISAIEVDILSIAAKRGKAGIDKAELLFELGKIVKGIAYADLARKIEKLRADRLITVEENGPDDFTVIITQQGSSVLSRP